MEVLIIEDEKIAAEKLERMLQKLDATIKVKAKVESIKKSINWLLKNPVDLIFLDIQLSDGISFSIFNQLQINTPIIFTTAYDQYAIKAFQLNSIAYLLKPIRIKDLEASLNKYKTLKSSFAIDFDNLLKQIQSKQPEYKKRFIIQIGVKLIQVDIAEIAYFFVFNKSVYMKLFRGNSYPVEFSLDKLEELINPNDFFRINRKYIINIKAISKMTTLSRSRVLIELTPHPENNLETIVSIDRASNFKKWLGR
ncbi:LytR/AlgR family response regulator transcription factor [Thermophagus sp. OGC60D27]|uniref:LytR/AlgR family response regulator transcription factor n=1 Tax=Thermophagus sp. OGC60D27 TaxID=3458415 RepID=UPI004037CD66